jgi:hypothetical protein
MEFKKENLDKVQKEYQQKLDDYEASKVNFEQAENLAIKERIPLPDIYQARVNKAGTALLNAERKFKDKVNLLLVDCLEAVVKNAPEAAEKFTLLNKYGPAAGFTKAQGDAMAGIRTPTANGGEK